MIRTDKIKTTPLLAAILLAALVVGAAVEAGGDPTPAPRRREISGFTRYIPGRDGEIEWEINGETARFLSANLVEMEGFVARAGGELAPLTLSTRRLVFDLNSNTGWAVEEWGEFRSDNIFLRGRGVVWDTRNQMIRFVEDVRFVIDETEGGGLFPL